MAGFVWLLGLVVGLAAVQLLLFRWLHRESGRSTTTRDGGQGGGDTIDFPTDLFDPTTRSGTPAAGDGAGRHCPHCGTENASEEAFTYCRACVKQLP